MTDDENRNIWKMRGETFIGLMPVLGFALFVSFGLGALFGPRAGAVAFLFLGLQYLGFFFDMIEDRKDEQHDRH